MPIVPEKWQLQPRPSVTKQLNVIKRFLHEASEIVRTLGTRIARELLVDEVLDYLQLAPGKAPAGAALFGHLEPAGG
ncbi:hypothetical protein ACLB1T_29295 [Escherichia coli]